MLDSWIEQLRDVKNVCFSMTGQSKQLNAHVAESMLVFTLGSCICSRLAIQPSTLAQTQKIMRMGYACCHSEKNIGSISVSIDTIVLFFQTST